MVHRRPKDATRAEIHRALEESHGAAYGWAIHCCQGHRDEAEDVLQTVYLKILGGKARYSARSSFRTWLFAVIRNTATDSRRLWMRRLRTLERLAASTTPPSQPSSEEKLLRSAEARRLADALRLLPPRQQEVLHLAFYQELPLSEVAEVLGISVGSVRKHYDRGKARLRRELGAPEDVGALRRMAPEDLGASRDD